MSSSSESPVPTIPSLSTLCAQSITSPLSVTAVSTHLNQYPFVPLDQSVNMRALTSPTLSHGILYRSGTLSQMSSLTASQLRRTYNIRTIYDLRRAEECEREPSPVIEGTETVWIPPRKLNRSILGGKKEEAEEMRTDEAGEEETTKDKRERRREMQAEEVPTSAFAEGDGTDAWRRFHANILHTHGQIFKAVLERLGDQGGIGEGGGGAVLFHCTGEHIHSIIISFFLFRPPSPSPSPSLLFPFCFLLIRLHTKITAAFLSLPFPPKSEHEGRRSPLLLFSQ